MIDVISGLLKTTQNSKAKSNKYSQLYIAYMTTLSADVTPNMMEWIDTKIKAGKYKSRSEVIRELLRNKMNEEEFRKAPLSEKALQKIWDNEKDNIWETYL